MGLRHRSSLPVDDLRLQSLVEDRAGEAQFAELTPATRDFATALGSEHDLDLDEAVDVTNTADDVAADDEVGMETQMLIEANLHRLGFPQGDRLSNHAYPRKIDNLEKHEHSPDYNKKPAKSQ